MTTVIAVHCGAGNYRSSNHSKYKKLMKTACSKAMKILEDDGSAMDAVTAAIARTVLNEVDMLSVLEDDPLTNSGFGSNLTQDGEVETDASIMDGRTLSHGACGAVKRVKNPIRLAAEICKRIDERQPLGLVPPCLLVADGALAYAKSLGLEVVPRAKMRSIKAKKQYEKLKKILVTRQSHGDNGDGEDCNALDTVGAVCVDAMGHVAAGCSSGGLLLKKSGRVGQAGVYGGGIWADSCDDTSPGLAVCTTGCGEHLIRTQLAREIAQDLKQAQCPTTELSRSISLKFIDSRYLKNVSQKLCGAMVLSINQDSKDVNVLWGHNTESMGIAYMSSTQQKPVALISELPNGIIAGRTVNVGGTYLCSSKKME